MRVVIDTNRLEDEELRIFLSASAENMAVLPEHTMVEIFKPRALEAVYAQFSVLADYPKQVLVVKGNRRIAEIDPRAPAISNRFIDREQTRLAPRFFSQVKAAQEGHKGYQKLLIERRGWSIERVQIAVADMGDQSETLAELREMFGAEDLRRLAAGRPSTQRFRDNLISAANYLAESLKEDRTRRTLLPPPARYYDFTWRYALCHLIQGLNLAAQGALRRAPVKSANDHFDNVFATFGTYFNGVMSMDRNQLMTHAIARIVLTSLGVRLAQDYIESGYILTLLDALDEGAAVSV